MCDTIVALGNSTQDGSVLFGKNSDREPNEAHELVIIPPGKHSAGSRVNCTYIEIPQATETYQVLLAKPFWIWGAEMGSNEFGVTIGNEAVFTRTPYEKKPSLIGMDFLRLALERTRTAEGALDLITSLLEEYGQGGSCGFSHAMYYHNSYLICDYNEAWVLETSGREWAAEKVKDVRSISNAITIHKKWDRASENLVKEAVLHGWCKREEDFDFARCYSEPIYTRFSDAHSRQSCTLKNLIARQGKLTPSNLIAILRSHTGDNQDGWSPDRGVTGADVCMHAGWGPIRGSQTTGSLVTVLKSGEKPVHWVTGTASPCTSIFKPVWLDAGIYGNGSPSLGTYDESTLYWRHEGLHREILRDYSHRIQMIKGEQLAVESELLRKVGDFCNADMTKRREFSENAFKKANEVEAGWMERVRQSKVVHRNNLFYHFAWNRFNREAKLN